MILPASLCLLSLAAVLTLAFRSQIRSALLDAGRRFFGVPVPVPVPVVARRTRRR